MNGYVLARECQRLHPTIKVLLTTGFDKNMGSLEPKHAPEFDVINKPYSLSDLARRVRLIFDGVTGSGPRGPQAGG